MAVRCLCFSPSSRLYTGSDDKTIISYNVLTKESVVEHTYSGHSGWVTGVSVSADEQYLASWWRLARGMKSSGTDRKMIVWPLKTDNSMQTLDCHNGIVWSVAFNREGTRIVSTGDDGSIQIYDRQESI